MTVWIAIVASGVVTSLTRVLPLAVTMPGSAPARLRRYLDALPTAIIAALAGAGIAVPDAQPTGGAEILAAVVALAGAAWRRNLLFAVIAGGAAGAALRAAGL